MPLDEYRNANRANWDARVDLRYGSDEYEVDRPMREWIVELTSPLNYRWSQGLGETIDFLIRPGSVSIGSRNTTNVSGKAKPSSAGKTMGSGWPLPAGRELFPLIWSVVATEGRGNWVARPFRWPGLVPNKCG